MILNDLSKMCDSQLLPDFVSSFFLANIVGSFVMGVFVPMNSLFLPNYKSWYIGVTTGFCGSCTTFSTWQRVTAEKIANGQLTNGFMTLLYTFSTSYMAFLFGKHIGNEIFHQPFRCWRRQRFGEVAVTVTNTDMSTTHVGLRTSTTRYVYLFIVTCFMSAAIWVAVFVDTTSKTRRRYWAAAALGPIGSLARYFLLLLNRNRPTFPLFTFLVNVGASVVSSIILAIFVRLSNESETEKRLAYDLWFNYGVGAGILGCFSTVSTFVNEIHKLSDTRILHAYRYGLLSIVASQILCVVIVCSTFL